MVGVEWKWLATTGLAIYAAAISTYREIQNRQQWKPVQLEQHLSGGEGRDNRMVDHRPDDEREFAPFYSDWEAVR